MNSLNHPLNHPCHKTFPTTKAASLNALAFFLGRDTDAQARACLCMYLRQSEPRIMAQVKYYAHRLSTEWGREVSEYDMLDLIATNPEKSDPGIA